MTAQAHAIVGDYYRPPAKALLSHLPGGTPLQLIPEPDNISDSNAMAVWLPTDAIKQSEPLDAQLALYNFTLAQIQKEPFIQLGYIPRTVAAQLRATGITDTERRFYGMLGFAPNGAPLILFNSD